MNQSYYYNPIQNNELFTGIINEFLFLYYYEYGWSFIRPTKLFIMYPIELEIEQSTCYSGYNYESQAFEGTYFGISKLPTEKILYVYKQFNTDKLYQSIDPPTQEFKVPSQSTSLELEFTTSMFLGIKLDNLDDALLLLT